MFTLINNKVSIDAEILFIPEFKILWDKDTSKDKDKVLKEFAFIYFTEDFKSPYKKSLTGEDLINKVKIDLFNSSWKPNKELDAAKIKYKELKTTHSMKLLEGAEKQIKEITDFLNNSDLSSIDEDKRHIAVKNMINVLKELDELTLKLQSTKSRIEKELEAAKMSGKRTLGKRELPPSKRK